MLISLSSCAKYGLTRTSGYFKYKVSESGEILLVGLTKKGQQQETIVIPSEIDGKQVYRIGEPYWEYPGSYHWKCDFKSDNLKCLYINSNASPNLDEDNFYADLSKLENVFWGSKYDSIEIIQCSPKNKSIYVSTTCYEYNEFSGIHYDIQGRVKDYSYIKVANVVYYLNDDTKDTFFVDDCDGTIVNVVPPNPIREGYKFKGWYKEKECINKWDFEKDIIPSKEYDKEDNYIFKETAIYAGWEIK